MALGLTICFSYDIVAHAVSVMVLQAAMPSWRLPRPGRAASTKASGRTLLRRFGPLGDGLLLACMSAGARVCVIA
jgi:hypothetical protein